jgi:hypothetical protein
MKRTSFIALVLLLAPPLFADATHLIPAGSLVSCMTGDGRISSRTTAVGDPVLCKVEFRRGDFMLPYGSYLGGQFAEYKDPGHFVGKGWMQLEFDRLYVGDQVLPINAKVVDVPGYKIDQQGRILGKGHEARDITLWSIPVLWPVDLIMLPMRGPRPTLKPETALTLRVMDDIQIPTVQEPQRDPYGLMQRSPNSYDQAPPPPTQAPDAGPQNSYAGPAPQQMDAPPPPPAMSYAPAMPYAAPMPYAPPVVAYGSIVVGPGPYYARSYAPYYAPRGYGAPVVRSYGYGYAGHAVAPSVGVRAYGGYGYAARGYGGGFTSRGPVIASRGAAVAARGYAGGGYSARGGMAYGGRAR